MRRHLILCLALGGFAGCSPSNEEAQTGSAAVVTQPRSVYYHKDVAPILNGRCLNCHHEAGIAPMSLGGFEQAYAYRDAIAAATSARTMPPWGAEPGHQSYVGDISLSAEQMETLRFWAEQGAAEGNAADAGEALEPVGSALSRVDLSLDIGEAYRPRAKPDDYHCFVIDWPLDRTTYVSGLRVRPGNEALVHHAIAYMAYPRGATAVNALDPEGDGYTCYGGPGEIGPEPYDYGSLGGWVPGNDGHDYPANTGIRVEPGSKVVLQVHYYTGVSEGEALTALDFKLDERVEREAFYIAWLNGLWLYPGAMPIRPWKDSITHSFTSNPIPYLAAFANSPVTGNDPFLIYSATLHMHEIGKSGTLRVVRQNGEEEILLRIPRWDFNWQREYQLERPLTFQRGDQLGITCEFDNSKDHQPVKEGQRPDPKYREWGESTEDEMCVGFFYTSPL